MLCHLEAGAAQQRACVRAPAPRSDDDKAGFLRGLRRPEEHGAGIAVEDGPLAPNVTTAYPQTPPADCCLTPAPGHYSAPAADPEEQVGRAPKLGRTAIGCTDMHCRLTWLTE